MALQRREKILAGAVGGLLVVLVAWFALFSGGGKSKADLKRDFDKLTAENRQKQEKIDAIRKKAAKRLADWNRRSLPSDPKIARPLYVRWLVGVVEQAGLRSVKLEPGEPRTRPGVYVAIPLVVRSQGSVGQLADFLHKFYSAGHLHKIRRLTVKRLEGGKDFELVMTIEALSLSSGDNRDKLATEPGRRLELPDLDAYRQVLVRRALESGRHADDLGIFAPYAPPAPPPPPPVVRVERKPDPPPPAPPPPPRFDPSKYAFVTAITEVDGKPQVWIRPFTEEETFKLHQGEKIEIGTVRGTVGQIDVDSRSVQIEIGGRSHVVRFGQNLHEAVNGGP